MNFTKEQLRAEISQASWRVTTWTSRRDEAAQQVENALRDKERLEQELARLDERAATS